MDSSQNIKKQKKILALLDSHAILHRSFHALPPFTSPSGEPTGAVYGFTAMLLKIIRELKPDYLAACYDLPGPTFRHIAYKEYKIQRPKMADELIGQIEKSRELLDAFQIPIFEFPGFEADDVIGTIVEKLKIKNLKLKIIIASGDLDILQLVKNDDVVVYVLSRGINEAVIYNEEKVKERYGFNPNLLPDFRGLKGDPSDNIPGIKGIGEKTASCLIQRFGSLEEIYKNLKEDKMKFLNAGIKERAINLVRENEKNAFFSRDLAKIRRDAPISFDLSFSQWSKLRDFRKVQLLFEKLGFKSLLSRLQNSGLNGTSRSIIK
jgi:DNA polymerase-1